MNMKLMHTNKDDFAKRTRAEAERGGSAHSDSSSMASPADRQQYQADLKDYCWKLQREAPTDLSTSLLLSELDRLLDRCGQLASPERETLFVEEVCKMGKRFNLAA